MVRWFKQGKVIQSNHYTSHHDNHVTISRLTITPSRTLHSRQIVCRAENPLLSQATLEDIYTLEVSYRPNATLTLGWPNTETNLTEGKDLHFQCRVDANPPPYKIQWYKDGSELVGNSSTSGPVPILREYTFSIQHIGRRHAGTYHCVASNVEGDSPSNVIDINVRFAPVCSHSNPMVVAAPIRKPTSIKCQVDANPHDRLSFTWFLSSTNSRHHSKQLRDSQYVRQGRQSTLEYTPRSKEDYGNISCRAHNDVGPQRAPCVYILVSEGPPEPVRPCRVINITSYAAAIECRPGFDGGLPQKFTFEVHQLDNHKLITKKTSSDNSIYLSDLQPFRRYEIKVTSHNARGSSQFRSLKIKTQPKPVIKMRTPAYVHSMVTSPRPPRPTPPRLVTTVAILKTSSSTTVTSAGLESQPKEEFYDEPGHAEIDLREKYTWILGVVLGTITVSVILLCALVITFGRKEARAAAREKALAGFCPCRTGEKEELADGNTAAGTEPRRSSGGNLGWYHHEQRGVQDQSCSWPSRCYRIRNTDRDHLL
ncbi:unnamed protein product [Meganyctiphanes norvegica]|uniref:Nephrin/kirre n=1 Tax=Meganyctiphanes norvegica TaxID=48144 RepID=A0AAV2QMF1_MEGNR